MTCHFWGQANYPVCQQHPVVQRTSHGTKNENLSEQQLHNFMANELNPYAQC